MSARINNFPLYVVYDRSYNQVVTTGGTSPTITGTKGAMTDGDLTTYYEINATSPVGGAGVTILIDYGRIFTNCQLSYKAYFEKLSGGGSSTWTIAYSNDNITYTTLDTGSIAGSDSITTSHTLLQMRYVKFKIANDTLVHLTRVYECRLMGSVSA